MPAYETDGRWRYRVTVALNDGTTVRISGSAPKEQNTKKGADAAERAHIYRAQHPAADAPAAKEVPTLREYVPIALPALALRLSPRTVDQTERRLEVHVLPILGDHRLDEINFAAIEDLKLHLSKKPRRGRDSTGKFPPLHKATVNIAMTALVNVLKYAHKRGVISAMPLVEYIPDAFNSRLEYYEIEEVPNLVDKASVKDPMVALMLELDHKIGARVGELCALQRDRDFIRARQTLVVRESRYPDRKAKVWRSGPTKGKREREIVLTDGALAIVEAIIGFGRPGPFLFAHEDGSPYTPHQVAYRVEQAGKRAGFKRRAGIHMMRHSFVSHSLTLGAPAHAVQQQAGHKSLATTGKYAHLSQRQSRAALSVLDQAVPVAVRTKAATENGKELPNPTTTDA
ncbi:MAG TPA: tyrosine-type recombinase/integrase [Kofleriaceae bacterium]|jgi:integrase